MRIKPGFYVIVRLRSHSTIFCKRVYARATFRHTDPLGPFYKLLLLLLLLLYTLFIHEESLQQKP